MAETLHETLMRAALGYPEAYEENPWGERVVKVRGKIFMFSSSGDGRTNLTVKLPQSGPAVLTRPCAAPTGYGLGKSGWVSLRMGADEAVTLDEMRAWIDESFRTVAPKRLSKTLQGLPPLAPSLSLDALPAVASRTSETAARARVVLVGSDPKRLERARAAFAARGVKTVHEGEPMPDVLARIGDTHPHAVLIDLGRLAAHAFEFARYLVDDMHGKVKVAFAGAHDVATEERARTFDRAVVAASRLPPGDPRFVEEMVSLLG